MKKNEMFARLSLKQVIAIIKEYLIEQENQRRFSSYMYSISYHNQDVKKSECI